MAALSVVNAPGGLTSLIFFPSIGIVTGTTAINRIVCQARNGRRMVLSGTGFAFDPKGPTGGTITKIELLDKEAGSIAVFTDVSISLVSFYSIWFGSSQAPVRVHGALISGNDNVAASPVTAS